MVVVFWFCFALLIWCYAGFPLSLRALAQLRPRPWRGSLERQPSVSVVVAVRNGAGQLRRRLDDLFRGSYPPDRLEVLVVCNGCTDGTEEIARDYSVRDPRVRVLESPAELGKSGALSLGVAAARGEFVVLADVRQTFHREAISRLLEPFGDPEVGAVSGRLVLARGGATAVEGVRWYWELETILREAESATGSVMGVTGAIYAIRRSAFEPLPPRIILDDVFVPLRLVLKRMRVVLAPHALAFDVSSPNATHEFHRKRRTMVGNLQLVREMPALLSPRRNPAFLRFISHKLLRLATPFFSVGLMLSAAALPGLLYRIVFGVGVLVYSAGVLGLFARTRLLALPAAFVLLHGAILSALFLTRRDAETVWTSAPPRATAAVQPVSDVQP